jgi:ATP-dependent DNA ligase
LDWTRRFKKVAADAFLIPASSAIIDGEIVVPAADGTTALANTSFAVSAVTVSASVTS